MRNAKAVARPHLARSISDWERVLLERLPLFGHRNWVVVADSAYPAQSRNGVETIVAKANHVLVVETVLARLRVSAHVKPIPYIDLELSLISERDAPGIDSYRRWLTVSLDTPRAIPHEEIISKIDHAGESFRVLVIKTDMTIPYTSIFLELDCAYWNAEAESRLRSAVNSEAPDRG